MLLIILIVLLVLALGGGFYGHGAPRSWGVYGWSPLGLILLVLVLLYFTGNLHGCQGVVIR